ncbi:hypothetical protein BSLG_009667 [Batrachochytrium salamandrivorans]|nr:hypothetical protein BSLG_009667 [Batrachochytrium salamandrivorans]
MELLSTASKKESSSFHRARSDDQLQLGTKEEQPLTRKGPTEAIVDPVGYVVPNDNGLPVSIDGFGSTDGKRKLIAVVHNDGLGETRSRRTSLSSVIKTSVNRASQFVRRIAHPIPAHGVQLNRATRASSLVYMVKMEAKTLLDGSSRTPKRIPGKSRAPSNTGTLRNLSNRLQNVLHMGSRSPMVSQDIVEVQRQQPTQLDTVNQIIEDPIEETEKL